MILFDAFLLWKKAGDLTRRRLAGGDKFYAKNYSWSLASLPKKLPRIIWIFWDSPLDDAPDIIKAAVHSWVRLNPTWEVRIMSKDTVSHYTLVPETAFPRKVQWRADLIRADVLRKFGGVWADASSFCVRPLDEWLPPLMQSGFFAFQETYPGRIMQNWFMASEADNYLVTKWSDRLREYYARHGHIRDYFWVMHMFHYLVATDYKAKAIWDLTPKLSPKGPILLKRILTQKKFAEVIPDGVDLSAIPVLKVSSDTKSDSPLWMDIIQHKSDVDLVKLTRGTTTSSRP